SDQGARAFCSGHRRRTIAIRRLPVLDTPRKLTKRRGSPSGTKPANEGLRLYHFCLLSPLTWVEQRCAQPRPELCFVVAGRVRTAQSFHRFLCLGPNRSATVPGWATQPSLPTLFQIL